MKSKIKKQTMLERLREVRDKISIDIQGMSAAEIEKYFSNKRRNQTQAISKSVAAEPKIKYGRTDN